LPGHVPPKRKKKKKIGIAKRAALAIEIGQTDVPRERFYSRMMKRATKKALPGESAERSLSRLLMANDPKVTALFKAQRFATAALPEVEVAKAAPVGPASELIQKLAEDYRNEQIAIGKRITPEQAFAAVYAAPENVALRDAVKAEEAARRGI